MIHTEAIMIILYKILIIFYAFRAYFVFAGLVTCGTEYHVESTSVQVFGGQNFLADKFFGTKLNFCQFCPPIYIIYIRYLINSKNEANIN